MGRPRVHDAQTAEALLRAAEAMIQEEGLAALSMRALAQRADVTTRAIYSALGSKEEVLALLATRGFALLGREVAGLPVTDDPQRDLIDAGLAFRRFALQHPSLYRLAFGPEMPAPARWPSARPAQQESLRGLAARVVRVAGADIGEAGLAARVLTFHAQCEGLAALEHRGALQDRGGEEAWRSALALCVHGLSAPER